MYPKNDRWMKKKGQLKLVAMATSRFSARANNNHSERQMRNHTNSHTKRYMCYIYNINS